MFRTLILSLLLGVPLSAAHAEEPLTLCHEDRDSYPWVLRDGSGLNLELLAQVAEALQLRLQLVAVPWKRCLAGLEDGHYDGAFAASFKAERLAMGRYPTTAEGDLDVSKRLHLSLYSLYSAAWRSARLGRSATARPAGAHRFAERFFHRRLPAPARRRSRRDQPRPAGVAAHVAYGPGAGRGAAGAACRPAAEPARRPGCRGGEDRPAAGAEALFPHAVACAGGRATGTGGCALVGDRAPARFDKATSCARWSSSGSADGAVCDRVCPALECRRARGQYWADTTLAQGGHPCAVILAVLPLVLLAGCSSFRPDAENITPVPGDRLLAYQDEFQNGGRLVVDRDMGADGRRLLRGHRSRPQAGGTHRHRRGRPASRCLLVPACWG